MVLMIDNYDSFTYNIVQYLVELGANVRVVRNDELSLAEIRDLKPQRIVISPGPCSPLEAGISVAVIRAFASEVPILGVCLGHQCIGYAFGGEISRAAEVMHGKTSLIHHSGKGVFAELANPFVAARYHSLVIAKASVPESLEITAWTQDKNGQVEEIMGVRHKSLAIEGVQFHPEAVLSEQGHLLLKQFLQTH